VSKIRRSTVGPCSRITSYHQALAFQRMGIRLEREIVSAFRPWVSLDRRVNCRRVSQPRWVGARRNTRGKDNKGNRGSCCLAPRADALAVGGYKRSRGRERESLLVSLSSCATTFFRTRALDLPFIDVRRGPRCTMGV
jgi:hypothetical protein